MTTIVAKLTKERSQGPKKIFRFLNWFLFSFFFGCSTSTTVIPSLSNYPIERLPQGDLPNACRPDLQTVCKIKSKKKLLVAAGTLISIPTGIYIYKGISRTSDESQNPKRIDAKFRMVILSDSISKNHFHSSVPTALMRMHTNFGHDWFLDTDASPDSVYSFHERISALVPTYSKEFGRTGAFIKRQNPLLTEFLNNYSLEEQIDRLETDSTPIPDIVFVNIGHNDLDSEVFLSELDLSKMSPIEILETHTKEFIKAYRSSIERIQKFLGKSLRPDSPRVHIVLVGLINPMGYKLARESAEKIHAQDSKQYPYIEDAYTFMPPLRPERRETMVKLLEKLNFGLRSLAAELDSKTIKVIYSDVLENLPISKADDLHPVDGWHLSPKSHNKISEDMFQWTQENLQIGFKGGFYLGR